ncbi:methionine ABC transporter ATPase [Salmonella enterica subsp. enterica serovar Sanjuan]|uniref:Methionine ABC transporter ATPase n=1 Tax=Salmonella enterica subsp. enterica serovar Sanjuan TaxID=1160765 RepID=A0A447NZI4_SALET|nr:methionine ABC transporter ATPase [Salmonella enterica subsp. enterica serovar Sanjuan]
MNGIRHSITLFKMENYGIASEFTHCGQHAITGLRITVCPCRWFPANDRIWRRARAVWRHGEQAIAPTLKEKGYKVVVREFSDYVQPNMALANGSIDANLFQHTLYFDNSPLTKG